MPDRQAALMPRFVSGACVVAMVFAHAAIAQVTSTSDYLSRMDTDGDRRVSLAEFQVWMGYAFERMDANGDGVVSANELPGGHGRAISLADHRASLAATFAKQDVNRDGFLSAKELAAPPQR